ncbi:hypothetical protein FOCC_FOCC004370, partial [Frankliniella occidentalis]
RREAPRPGAVCVTVRSSAQPSSPARTTRSTPTDIHRMQCSTLFVLAALACCALAQRVPSQDQVTKALMDLDRIYSKRDPGMKSGDELLKLKQAYKLLMLQDLDNRYKMINRPRSVN